MSNNIPSDQAMISVIWNGNTGRLGPIPFDTQPDDVLDLVTDAIRNGKISGIPADPNVSLDSFTVGYLPLSNETNKDNPPFFDKAFGSLFEPFNRIFILPKSPFKPKHTKR